MKIHIIGCSGSGKTYFAKALSNKYNIPHFDLDDIQWDNSSNSYGVKMPVEKRDALLKEILEKEAWIIEGVYYSWVLESFEKADIIYVLDIPKHIYKSRIIIRFLKRKIGKETGKKETLKSVYNLLKWTDTFQNTNLKDIKKILENFENKVVYISSVSEVDQIISDHNMNEVAKHYNILIDEGQDPVHDPKPLKEYMDKWDGQVFIDKMQLDKSKSVLEIGVGTGRIAVKVAPYSKQFTGIDISEKTIEKAKKNIKMGFLKKPELICADFLQYDFNKTFDVVYSSLTFLHIKEKQKAFNVISSLLNPKGLFVLSIDKNQDEYINTGSSRIRVFPDNAEDIKAYAKKAWLNMLEVFETELAIIFVFSKQ